MKCSLPGFAIKDCGSSIKKRQPRRTPPDMADKLRKLLFALETAGDLEQVGRFPGWKLHPLKGDLKGFWSLTVTGNWGSTCSWRP
jgi:proteic killer suppression protein